MSEEFIQNNYLKRAKSQDILQIILQEILKRLDLKKLNISKEDQGLIICPFCIEQINRSL